jgi:hypothetical protein
MNDLHPLLMPQEAVEFGGVMKSCLLDQAPEFLQFT